MTVTPEMLEAAQRVAPGANDQAFTEVYLAMRALDPEFQNVDELRDTKAAFRAGLLTAARMVHRFMGEQFGENSALMIDVDAGVQADKATLAYVHEALKSRAALNASGAE